MKWPRWKWLWWIVQFVLEIYQYRHIINSQLIRESRSQIIQSQSGNKLCIIFQCFPADFPPACKQPILKAWLLFFWNHHSSSGSLQERERCLSEYPWQQVISEHRLTPEPRFLVTMRNLITLLHGHEMCLYPSLQDLPGSRFAHPFFAISSRGSQANHLC